MAREYRFLTDTGAKLRTFGWLSLLGDGSISVGMSDRTFVARVLASYTPVDGSVHQTTVDLPAKMKLKALRNPHLTFHPPLKFHLHANGEEEIFDGIMDVDLVVQTAGRLPWIRFISNPVRELKSYQPRSGQDIEVVRFLAPNESVSMRLSVDFVPPIQEQFAATNSKSLLFSIGDRTIEVFVETVPAQHSSLDWYHES